MIALLTLFLATVFIIIVRCWHKWNTEDAIIGIINPPTLPILGNLLDLWNSIRNNKGDFHIFLFIFQKSENCFFFSKRIFKVFGICKKIWRHFSIETWTKIDDLYSKCESYGSKKKLMIEKIHL